jgi:hypothetical protein
MEKGGHSLHFHNVMNFFGSNPVAIDSADKQLDLESAKIAN